MQKPNPIYDLIKRIKQGDIAVSESLKLLIKHRDNKKNITIFL